MSLTNIAMLGILLGFVFLVVGFLMEGPDVQTELEWNKSKKLPKKVKKSAGRVTSRVMRKRAA